MSRATGIMWLLTLVVLAALTLHGFHVLETNVSQVEVMEKLCDCVAVVENE